MGDRRKYTRKGYGMLRHADGAVNSSGLVDGVSINNALGQEFGIEVTAPSTATSAVRVALLAGHYDTSAYATTATAAGTPVKKTNSDPTALKNAGYVCDVVADDGSFALPALKGTGSVVMRSLNPQRTVQSLMEYIKSYRMMLKGLRVIANDQTAFDGNLIVAQSTPFDRGAEKTISLNNFYSAFQYSNDRVSIDLSAAELDIERITMLFADVPPGCTMKFFLKF
jgi:hypothetical protein